MALSKDESDACQKLGPDRSHYTETAIHIAELMTETVRRTPLYYFYLSSVFQARFSITRSDNTTNCNNKITCIGIGFKR